MSTPRRLAPRSIGTPTMSTRSTGESVVLTASLLRFKEVEHPHADYGRLQEPCCAAIEPTPMLRATLLAAIALSVVASPPAPALAYLPPPLAHLNRDMRSLARQVPAAI